MGTRLALIAVCACACFAQDWEMGGAIGYGAYRNGTIFSPAGTATAGIRNRFALSAVAAEELYEHIAGEIRYVYQDGDPFLSGPGGKSNVQGHSHAVSYDLLVHLHDRDTKIRPFLAVGAGVKVYQPSGPAPASQPLGAIGTLTGSSETKPMFTIGPGVKVRVAQHVVVRADLRDMVTTFPKKLIAPAAGATGRGYFQQITFLIGISGTF